MLQPWRMLSRLLDGKPGSRYSVEVLEDVAEQDASGGVVVDQVKSSISKHNPIADTSTDFWKTLRNWSDEVNNGVFDANTTRFFLYCSKHHNGAVAESFHASSNLAVAQSALLEARKLLTSNKLRGDALDHARVFLDASNQSTSEAIIRSFELDFGSGRTEADIDAQLREKFISDDQIIFVRDTLIGWINSRIVNLLQSGASAIIHYEEFEAEAKALFTRVRNAAILKSYASDPTNEDIESELKGAKTYVIQLDIIEVEEQDRVQAVIDYLRAKTDVIHWAENGDIHESGLRSFKDKLHRQWRSYKQKAAIDHRGQTDVALGQYLYAQCCGYTSTLDGAEPPSYFCTGIFQDLSDNCTVGWHPNYTAELQARRQKGASSNAV